jgi:histidinol-phosphate aminotransferase
MTTPPEPQPGIMEIALYEGGGSALPGVAEPLKLSSNENPHGPPPTAVEAARAAAAEMHRYPGTDHAALRSAIAEVHGLDADRVICGVGSDEILHWLCQAYVGPGTEVLHTEHGFLMYPISARAAGGSPVKVPERERRVDVDALIDALTPATRLVFVANPANPTGTLLAGQEVRRLADGLPDGCMLVLDGAYAEFAGDFDGGLRLAAERENVFVTRTFSKAYGLGGMRVGWGYGTREVIDVLNRIRGPFNLSGPALAAAEAAMRDREFVSRVVAANARERTRLTEGLRALGLAVDASEANFVLARFGGEEAARAADTHLRGEGIIVRHVAAYGFPEALRISVGREEDVDRVLASLGRLAGGRAA